MIYVWISVGTVVAWVVMAFVGTNLLGYVVRGLLEPPPPVDAPTDRVVEFLNRESRRMWAAGVAVTVLFLILTVAYFFSLYYFGNLGLAISAGLMMASRLPGLLHEIRTGAKITKDNMPKGVVYFFAGGLLPWLLAPLIWYSLWCKWS